MNTRLMTICIASAMLACGAAVAQDAAGEGAPRAERREGGDRGPRQGGDRGPRQGGERGPRQGGDRGPRQGGDRGPRQGGDRGPGQGGERGPGQGGWRGRGGQMGGMMGGMMGAGGFDQNDMMVRMITNQRVLEELGLDAALREKIQFGIREIDNEQVEIQAGIQRLQQQEADLLLALLENREDTGEELAKIIDQIALNRAEIAKLPIKSLVYLRDQLTDDQLAKLIGLYKERRDRFNQRMEQFNNRGQRGPGQNGQPPPPPPHDDAAEPGDPQPPPAQE